MKIDVKNEVKRILDNLQQRHKKLKERKNEYEQPKQKIAEAHDFLAPYRTDPSATFNWEEFDTICTQLLTSGLAEELDKLEKDVEKKLSDLTAEDQESSGENGLSIAQLAENAIGEAEAFYSLELENPQVIKAIKQVEEFKATLTAKLAAFYNHLADLVNNYNWDSYQKNPAAKTLDTLIAQCETAITSLSLAQRMQLTGKDRQALLEVINMQKKAVFHRGTVSHLRANRKDHGLLVNTFWQELDANNKSSIFTWTTLTVSLDPNHPNYHLASSEEFYWKSYGEVVKQPEPDLNNELSNPTVHFIIKPAKNQSNFTFFNTVLPVDKLNKQSYETYEAAKDGLQPGGKIYSVLQYPQQDKPPGMIEFAYEPEQRHAKNSFVNLWEEEKTIIENLLEVFGKYKATAEKFRIVSRRNLHQGKQAGLILAGLKTMGAEPENYGKIIALLAEQRTEANACNSNGEFAYCVNFALTKIASEIASKLPEGQESRPGLAVRS